MIEDIKNINVKYAFPIPVLGLRSEMTKLKENLKKYGIITKGRYGNWEYAGIEHSVEDGLNINSEVKYLL